MEVIKAAAARGVATRVDDAEEANLWGVLGEVCVCGGEVECVCVCMSVYSGMDEKGGKKVDEKKKGHGCMTGISAFLRVVVIARAMCVHAMW